MPSSLTNTMEDSQFCGEYGSGSYAPMRAVRSTKDDKNVEKEIASSVENILEALGEDKMRSGLVKTPERMAKALMYCTSGYQQTLQEIVGDAIFDEDHRDIVIVRDIDFASLCEHHMVPFIGKVHIGYIPNGKVLGLSKFARIADMFARRLQVQERLTTQIANAVVEVLNPFGVAVVVEATHMCMVMRGVQKTGSSTVTSALRGKFETDAGTRAEFYNLVNFRGRSLLN